MPEYIYVVKDLGGKTLKGRMETDNLEGFYRAIREKDQFCVSVRETGEGSKSIDFGEGRPIALKNLSIFCRQFSTMLNAGLPVIKCLDILYRQTEKKQMKEIVLGVYESVQRGQPLSKAMKARKNAFPLLMLNMIEAGEAGGTLDTVMKRLADQFERENKLRNKVRQAMVYPIFLLCVSFLVVIFLLSFILPRFVGMFKQFGGKLPGVTQGLLNVSYFITGNWFFLIVAVILIVVLWKMFLKSEGGRRMWDRTKLRLPVIGHLLMILEASRFASTLSSLFSSGLPIIQSIEIVAKVVKNRHIRDGLYEVNEEVRRGISISASVRKLKLFPLMLCSMLSVGEESGNMDEILAKTASFYDEEADAALQKMVSLIEPIMIVLLALVVGFIIIATITPVFSLYQQINATGGM